MPFALITTCSDYPELNTSTVSVTITFIISVIRITKSTWLLVVALFNHKLFLLCVISGWRVKKDYEQSILGWRWWCFREWGETNEREMFYAEQATKAVSRQGGHLKLMWTLCAATDGNLCLTKNKSHPKPRVFSTYRKTCTLCTFFKLLSTFIKLKK